MIKEWLMMKYALWLDRNPDYCWASLCLWALGHKPFISLFDTQHDEHDYKRLHCYEEYIDGKHKFGWCGKCERTGKIDTKEQTND